MSFGFSIGDFLAAIHTIKRVAEAVQSYKDAPRHFQQLSAELRLLHDTLECVLHIQTTDPNELPNLDRIRMISMHCHQALQAFIDKMRPKETSLGHFRSAGTASTIGRKLHWSLVAKKDVDDLRKVIVSEMVAVNVLLGVQQLAYLRMRSIESSTFQNDTREYFLNCTALLAKSVEILQDVKTLPQEIHTLKELAVDNSSKQDALYGKILGVSGILSQSAKKFGNQATKTMIGITSLATNIKRLLILLSTFSKEILRQIAANTKMLLDMHANIKRILRAIEAVPLHLTLDIVRFDDALGESWALPFQVCIQWDTFKEMLQTVVFRNHRPGSARVAFGQFIITSAKDNSEIYPASWESTIKPGAHISQSMIVSSKQSMGGRCQFPSCNERLTVLPISQRGPKCGRWSIIRGQSTNILQLVPSGEAKYSPTVSNETRRPLSFEGPSLPAVQTFADDIDCFRRIHMVNSINPVNNVQEANALLREDSENARALQFIAWFKYPHRSNMQEEPRNIQTLESIINLLTRSTISDHHDSQTWYLLGRAYMDIQKYEKAHGSYQQAVYRASDLPGYWISIGLLYFIINQYHDSLDALTRSIRLNHYIPEAWYNIGVLYEVASQPQDATYAYDRYLKLEQHPDPAVSPRLNYLRQIIADKAVSQEVPLPMKDIDLRGSLNQPQRAEHEEDIQIPGLNMSDSLDNEEDWTSTDEDEDEENSHSNKGV